MGSGQWAVGSGQWAVGSGQWAVGSGQWAVGGPLDSIGNTLAMAETLDDDEAGGPPALPVRGDEVGGAVGGK